MCFRLTAYTVAGDDLSRLGGEDLSRLGGDGFSRREHGRA